MREYLKSITEVCPFSLKHFDAGEVPILYYSPTLIQELYFELDKYPAIVFKCPATICRDVTQSTADELANEYPDADWYWSHPDEGGTSTPVPVLIMQNREHLTSARKQFKLEKYGSKMASKQKDNTCKKENINRQVKA